MFWDVYDPFARRKSIDHAERRLLKRSEPATRAQGCQHASRSSQLSVATGGVQPENELCNPAASLKTVVAALGRRSPRMGAVHAQFVVCPRITDTHIASALASKLDPSITARLQAHRLRS